MEIPHVADEEDCDNGRMPLLLPHLPHNRGNDGARQRSALQNPGNPHEYSVTGLAKFIFKLPDLQKRPVRRFVDQGSS